MKKAKGIKLEEISPNIFLFTFDDQYDMAMSFVRIQEFYESPKFKGKYFTLEEFMDYWAKKHGHDTFDYPVKWGGFNVPGDILSEWYRKFLSVEYVVSLRSREKKIMDMLLERLTEALPLLNIYVIAACKANGSEVIEHELAHAFYRLYPEYKKWCDKALKNISSKVRSDICKSLSSVGYTKKVFNDEMQAYFSVTSNFKRKLKVRSEFAKHFEEFKESIRCQE